jgi:16S rRNA pseudouridine516 synthase
MPAERLDKLISRLGYCTRNELRKHLDLVTVDGEPAKKADQKVEHRQVRWEGEPLDPDPLWVLLHKPAGYTCSTKDPGELVFDLLPERWMFRRPQLSTVGRLDKDSSGVLLLTDDGQALHRLTSPKSGIDKVYEVTLALPATARDCERLAAGGLMLEDETKPLLPCEVELVGEHNVIMVLHEGRYHQVKRMWAALGNEVVRLHRSRFGKWRVDDLEPGEYKLLEPEI